MPFDRNRLASAASAVVLGFAMAATPLSLDISGAPGVTYVLAKGGEGNGGGNGGNGGGGNGGGNSGGNSGSSARGSDDSGHGKSGNAGSGRSSASREDGSRGNSGNAGSKSTGGVGGFLQSVFTGQVFRSDDSGVRRENRREDRRVGSREDRRQDRRDEKQLDRSRVGTATTTTRTATLTSVAPLATASQMGRLNASRASASAFAHASPNSTIGRIREYMDAMALASAYLKDPETVLEIDGKTVTYNELIDIAASALTSAANKPIDGAVVDQVNANLGAKAGAPFDAVAVEDVKDKLAGI